jgi:hypothetical protein
MSTAKRLAALESKLIRPPEEPPVDLTSFYASVAICFINNPIYRDASGKIIRPKKARKNESQLTRLARAFRVSPERLMHLALNDAKGFAKRFGRFASMVGRCSTAEDVATEVVRLFLSEEAVWQMLETGIGEAGGSGGWLGRMMGEPSTWGLCPARPCRPAAVSEVI